MEPARLARVSTAVSTWEAVRARAAREHTALVSLVVVYFVAGRLGLVFTDERAVTLVSPSAGIAVGALLVLGYRIWPAILGAGLVVYASALGVTPMVPGLAMSNTAEALLAAYLVNRYAGGRHAFQDPRQCLRFVGVVLLSVATGATLSAASVAVANPALATGYGEIWVIHAIGNFAAVLLIAPVIVQYSQLNTRERFVQPRSLEPASALVLLAICCSIAFFDVPYPLAGFPKELLCLPLLFWVALRLGRRMASVALLMLAILAIAGTIYGTGPFARSTLQSSLIVLQFFLILSSVMTLVMATLAAEYSIAEAQLRELVVTDPLTGLPNYRRLLEVLGSEISRSDRSHRPFAVVFFDMDGLKQINDTHGHLVGSRAVCRFAETLRSACRTTDTPARYGGDEFVAVLSDTDYEGAKLVIKRTVQRLAEDTDQPRLSVSAGLALYPRDGGTPTTLLSAADRALYAAKADKANARTRVVAFREWTSAS